MCARPAVLLCLVAVLLAAPAGADAAGWAKPVTLAHGADGGPRIGANQSGEGIVVWRQARRLAYARTAPGGAFGPTEAIPGEADSFEGENDFSVELDEEGNAVLAWRHHELGSFDEADPCCELLDAAAIPAGGALGPVAELPSHRNVLDYDVDLDPLGGASVAWTDELEVSLANAPRFGEFDPRRVADSACGDSVNVGLTAYPGLEDLVYVCPTPAPMLGRQVLADGPGPARRLGELNDSYDLLVESDRRDTQLLV